MRRIVDQSVREAAVCASSPRRAMAPSIIGGALVCLLALGLAGAASGQTLLANYPLLTDLADTTATYADAQLLGNPTPPDPPNNGVCLNGIYYNFTDGQDVRTPDISALDPTDFQIDVDFMLNAMPSGDYADSVIMGSFSYRWIGILIQPDGTIGVKYNNSNYLWSTTTVTTGIWYSAELRFEAGHVQLFLDGMKVLDETGLGTLDTGGYLEFTANDAAMGEVLNGCLRNLSIYNDTTLSMTNQIPGVPVLGRAGAGLLVLLLTAGGLMILRRRMV